MADVFLSKAECRQRVRLPGVCIVCGKPTKQVLHRTFVWFPMWTYLCLCFIFIVQIIFRQTMDVHVPVCSRHRYYWGIKTAIMCVGVVAMFVLLIGMPVYYVEVIKKGIRPKVEDSEFTKMLLINAGLFIVNAIVLTFIVRRGIKVKEISRDGIAFSKVAPEFVQAVEEMREERENPPEQLQIIEEVRRVAKSVKAVLAVAKPKSRPNDNNETINPLPDSAID